MLNVLVSMSDAHLVDTGLAAYANETIANTPEPLVARCFVCAKEYFHRLLFKFFI